MVYGCNAVCTNIGINVVPVNADQDVGLKSEYYCMNRLESTFKMRPVFYPGFPGL